MCNHRFLVPPVNDLRVMPCIFLYSFGISSGCSSSIDEVMDVILQIDWNFFFLLPFGSSKIRWLWLLLLSSSVSEDIVLLSIINVIFLVQKKSRELVGKILIEVSSRAKSFPKLMSILSINILISFTGKKSTFQSNYFSHMT